MIFTERNITIRNDSATINAPVILYRGDKNVEVRFILIESPYKYTNRDSINIFESTDASYAQLVIKTPNDREPIFGDITAVGNNNVTFVIRHDMIDEIEEVGKYDFQIRLFDADQTSMATTPEVVGGFIIKEPIAKEDSNNNITNSAIVGSAVVTNDLEIPTFVGSSYNKTEWHDGDVISRQKLNKMEYGIYETYELSKENSSQIKERATKQEVEVERKRIDAFTSLSEGSTTGDAELIDIRTGIDGIVYDNAGSAVRGQSLIFDKQINAMRNILAKNEIIDFDIIEENKVYSAGYPNGTSLIDFYSYIKNVNYGDVYYVSTGVPANEQYGVAFLYNSNDELVKVVNNNTTGSNVEYYDYEVIIPYGIVKMIIVTHKDYESITRIKKANFLTNYKYEDICDIANSLAPFKDSLYAYNYETINANIEMGKVYSLVFKDGTNLNNSFCTYYLTVEEGETYNIKMTTIANPDYTAVLLYNDTGYVNYIDRNPSSEARTIDITFTIPKNVNLIRMTSRTDTPFSINKVTKEVPNMNDIVKTINSIENNVVAPNFSYNIDDTGIDIIFKCGNTDFKVRLAKKGGNNLFDFYKFGKIENNSDLPSLDFANVTNLGTSNTDWHSPFIVGAINNIDGDNKNSDDSYNWHFTGGNHQYNNQGSGSTATARLTDLKYYVNGKEVTSGSGYGNILEIRWTNMIQGYNTTKSDGTGREILQENHTLMFDGIDWKSSNELIPLEDIIMRKCFGFQFELINIFKNTIQYVGGSNRKVISANEASNCGTGKATKIIANGTLFGVSMEIDTTYDVGTFTDVPSPYLFTTDYGKSYFNLFSGNMSKGDRYYYRGTYKFYSL